MTDIKVGYDELSPTEVAELKENPELTNALIKTVAELEWDADRRGWDHLDNMNRLFFASYRRTEGSPAASVCAEFPPELQGMFNEAAGFADSVGHGLLTVAEALEGIAQEYGNATPPSSVEGMSFYGWGLVIEGWGADDDDSEKVEVRRVLLVGRDGFMWMAERHRGSGPATCVVKLKSAEPEEVGVLVHALIRLTNASSDVQSVASQ